MPRPVILPVVPYNNKRNNINKKRFIQKMETNPKVMKAENNQDKEKIKNVFSSIESKFVPMNYSYSDIISDEFPSKEICPLYGKTYKMRLNPTGEIKNQTIITLHWPSIHDTNK